MASLDNEIYILCINHIINIRITMSNLDHFIIFIVKLIEFLNLLILLLWFTFK